MNSVIKNESKHPEWLVSEIIRLKAEKFTSKEFNEYANLEMKTLVVAHYGNWDAILQISMDTIFLFRNEMIANMYEAVKFCETAVEKLKLDPVYSALERQHERNKLKLVKA